MPAWSYLDHDHDHDLGPHWVENQKMQAEKLTMVYASHLLVMKNRPHSPSQMQDLDEFAADLSNYWLVEQVAQPSSLSRESSKKDCSRRLHGQAPHADRLAVADCCLGRHFEDPWEGEGRMVDLVVLYFCHLSSKWMYYRAIHDPWEDEERMVDLVVLYFCHLSSKWMYYPAIHGHFYPQPRFVATMEDR